MNDSIIVNDIMKNRQDRLPLAFQQTFDDDELRADVRFEGYTRRESTGFEVKGSLTGTAERPCDRCLQPMVIPLDVTVNERYVLESLTQPNNREAELSEEDFYEVIPDDGALDLRDLARQLILLETVSPQTCGREDCRTPGMPILPQEQSSDG